MIYYSKPKRSLRVYSRYTDKHEQTIPMNFKNKTNRADHWSLACSIIEKDKRRRSHSVVRLRLSWPHRLS